MSLHNYTHNQECRDVMELIGIVLSFQNGIPEDGGGIGLGDHFLPHKFIEKTFEC